MSNKILITGIFAASLCLFLQTPSYAAVYKWLDQDGQVHYGSQPGKTDAEKITIRNNETTKPRPIKKAENDGNEKTEGKNPEDTNKETTAEKPEKPTLSKKEKRQLCNEAKSDIASIASRGRMREINAKGEYSYLSEKQRQQRLTSAKKKQGKYCR